MAPLPDAVKTSAFFGAGTRQISESGSYVGPSTPDGGVPLAPLGPGIGKNRAPPLADAPSLGQFAKICYSDRGFFDYAQDRGGQIKERAVSRLGVRIACIACRGYSN